MGLSLEASRAYTARPAYFDALASYDAADGEVLWPVFSRKKDLLYYLFRYVCKLVRYFKPDVRNPLKLEIEGLWKTEEQAIEHVKLLLDEAERRGEKIGVNYGPLAVNRAFPYEQVAWAGLTDPAKWFGKRERGQTPRSRLVSECEWRAREMELGEWRSGRRETDDNAQLKRALVTAIELGRDVRALSAELDRIEKGD